MPLSMFLLSWPRRSRRARDMAKRDGPLRWLSAIAIIPVEEIADAGAHPHYVASVSHAGHLQNAPPILMSDTTVPPLLCGSNGCSGRSHGSFWFRNLAISVAPPLPPSLSTAPRGRAVEFERHIARVIVFVAVIYPHEPLEPPWPSLVQPLSLDHSVSSLGLGIAHLISISRKKSYGTARSRWRDPFPGC